MIINNLTKAKYKSRPNRFTIEFEDYDNNIQLAHLHDPGRLKELLIENTEILVEYVPDYNKTNRKTKYNMIAIKYQKNWVLLNSSFHNRLVEELINNKNIKPLKNYHVNRAEYTYGNSRLDFLLSDEKNNELYLEVKGCTLVVDNIAKFPDAPTTRGTKHVNELIKIKEEGKNSAIIILVLQNNARLFKPNKDTDPEFSKTLEKAYDRGVEIYPIHILTEYHDDSIELKYDNILKITFNE